MYDIIIISQRHGREVLDMITRQPLYELVAQEIKKHIIKNGLRPGDKLPTEKEMCERFGVSRSSVREAIKSLQSLGIIKSKQREGIILRNLTPNAFVDYLTFGLQFGDATVGELVEARRIVEIGILPLAIDRAEPDDFEAMEYAVSAMEAAGDDLKAYATADEAFHRALIMASKNRALSMFGDVVTEFFAITLEGIENARVDRARISGEHKAIIAALKDKDLACAAAVLEKHLAPYQDAGHFL